MSWSRVKAAGTCGMQSLGKALPGHAAPRAARSITSSTDVLHLEQDEPLQFTALGINLSHGVGAIVPAAQGVGGSSFDLCPRALFGISWESQ